LDRQRRISILTAALTAAILMSGTGDLSANARLGGRLIWTYQNNKAASSDLEAFLQRYQLEVRDRVFNNSDMLLSLYVNSSKNFTDDQTLLRYRGELLLSNQYYTFDARYAPRQDITPLQSSVTVERTEQRYNLDLHVPKLPQLRVNYAERARYFQGVFDGRVRDMRGDLRYRWRVFDFGINRWNTKSTNSTESGTTVSGASFRYSQSFGPLLNASAGYQGLITERSRTLSIQNTKSTSHIFNALLSGAYENILWGSASWISRRLTTNAQMEFENNNDTAVMQLKFLPTSPFRVETDWSYISSEQNGIRNLANYATVQTILTGPRRGRWHGLAQMAQRFPIERLGAGVIPSNLYFVSLRGQVYPGIDARAEFNVMQQHDDAPVTTERYQSTGLIDLFLKPRLSWLIAANVRSFRYSDRLHFLRNDRFNYGLTANYFARQYFTGGLDIRRNVLTTGNRRQDTSVAVNASLRMRSRSSATFSYGVNEYEVLNDQNTVDFVPNSRATTMNIQMQVWITRRGAVSFTYTAISRNIGDDTRYLALNYIQDF
jgi:hypothetical protein